MRIVQHQTYMMPNQPFSLAHHLLPCCTHSCLFPLAVQAAATAAPARRPLSPPPEQPPCQRRLTATSEFGLDGVSVDPLEVMFVKVKSYMLTSEWSFSKKAVKYQQWHKDQVGAGEGLGA